MSILDDVPDEVKLQIVQERLETWRNTYFLHSIGVEVARDIGDPKLEEKARRDMVRAGKAVKILEEKVGELEKKVGKSEDE